MPKPVLSDSLFNADDVATAVLAEANLQVANSDLGVTDVSSSFSNTSPYNTWAPNHAFLFMGFVFINLTAYVSSGSISSGDEVFDITDSDLYPHADYNIITSSHDGDTAERFVISASNGNITVINPHNYGHGGYHIVLNAWYRT